jgi:PAS domain-containing protein
LPVLVFLERAGKIVFANAEARQMLGVTEGEWVQRPVEDVLWGLFPGTAEPQTLLTGTRSRAVPFHATMPAKDGKLLPVEGTYSILDAELREAVIVAHPGGRERAPKSQLMEDVLASIPEAVAIEHGNHVLYTNPAFTRMFGYTAEEAGGGSLRELIVPETRLNEQATLEKAVDEQGRATGGDGARQQGGRTGGCEPAMRAAAGGRGQGGLRLYLPRHRRAPQAGGRKLQHDAMHDVLTGLPNRAFSLTG